jgi:hypothetical protein
MNARFTSNADIDATQTDVRFVPKADIRHSFDHLVGAAESDGGTLRPSSCG